MGWAWYAYDLATGAALGTLQMSTWTHTDILNDSGPFSATLVGASTQIRRDSLAATVVARSVIVPVRHGQPLGYAGITWRPNPPTVDGAGLLSYFDAQTLDVRKADAAIDQHTLIADLVNWVQAAGGGTIQVDTSQVDKSGVLRDQTWQKWEAKNVGDAIRQKGDNIQGFDFDVRVEVDNVAPIRRLRLWTPRRGRPYIDGASPVFTLAGRRGNVRDISGAPRDGLQMVTEVVALGQEIDPDTHERLIAYAYRNDLRALGWPRLVKVLDLPDIKVLTTLQQHADGYAYYYGASAIDEIVLQVDPDNETYPWGSWDLGDDCRVSIPAGVHPWFPDGFNDTRRVTAHRWTVDDSGETLEVTTGRLLGT